MSEPHTTGQSQGIAVTGLRSEGLFAIPEMINTRCRAQFGLCAAAHEAVVAIDGQHCRALLARSLTGQPFSDRVGQGAVFSLRSQALDTRWAPSSPGAPSATVAIIAFPLRCPRESSSEPGLFVRVTASGMS